MTMDRWRWDQGRMEYFDGDNVRAIARTLTMLEGVPLSTEPDPLRTPLERATGLPFAPADYRVWRNYKRVFGTMLLATEIDGKLICTELCHAVADKDDPLLLEEYLWHLVRSWYLDSPVFTGYSGTGERIYPFCLMIRRLLSTATNGSAVLTVDDVFRFLAGNAVTGNEPLERFRLLRRTDRVPAGDELRQVREMMRFLSQLPFLFWRGSSLSMDVHSLESGGFESLWEAATPRELNRVADPRQEILALGRRDGGHLRKVLPLSSLESSFDEEFTEGSKVRVAHLRVERNRSLTAAFFNNLPTRARCDMCDIEPQAVYPWIERLLEPHHVLPLSSSIRLEKQKTSLRDLVPVCPNCHRAVHKFYSIWLKSTDQRDFKDASEAFTVYNQAKRSFAA